MSKLVTHIRGKLKNGDTLCGRNENEIVMKLESWSYPATCGSCIYLRGKHDPMYPEVHYRPKVKQS